MGRTRRELWETLNLDYSRALPPYRWFKRYLSYAAVFAAIGWVTWAALRGDETLYSSGQLAVGHLAFGEECMRCHIPGRGYRHLLDGEKSRALNGNCLVCHGVAIGYHRESKTAMHQLSPENARNTPAPVAVGERGLACSSCHTEHQGYERLVDMSDHQCVQCHADLASYVDKPSYDAGISTFHRDPTAADQTHPEFSVLERGDPDPGQVRFNHRRHLKPSEPLLGPGGRHYALRCDDCHRAGDATSPWRFGSSVPHAPDRMAVTDSEPDLQDEYMGSIDFNLHCSHCHRLTVGLRGDQLRGNEYAPPSGAPHTTPAAVQTYLRGQLTAYIGNPNRPAPPAGAADRTPIPKFAGLSKEEVDRLKLEWIERELKNIELQLYGREDQACRHCHQVQPSTGASTVPVIKKPGIPRRWFASASFSHEKHKALPGPPLERTGWANCVECHENVLESTKTSDVLLPGIDSCRKCHAPHRIEDGFPVGGVSHSCVFCHTFHRPPAHPADPVVTGARGASHP